MDDSISLHDTTTTTSPPTTTEDRCGIKEDSMFPIAGLEDESVWQFLESWRDDSTTLLDETQPPSSSLSSSSSNRSFSSSAAHLQDLSAAAAFAATRLSSDNNTNVRGAGNGTNCRGADEEEHRQQQPDRNDSLGIPNHSTAVPLVIPDAVTPMPRIVLEDEERPQHSPVVVQLGDPAAMHDEEQPPPRSSSLMPQEHQEQFPPLVVVEARMVIVEEEGESEAGGDFPPPSSIVLVRHDHDIHDEEMGSVTFPPVVVEAAPLDDSEIPKLQLIVGGLLCVTAAMVAGMILVGVLIFTGVIMETNTKRSSSNNNNSNDLPVVPVAALPSQDDSMIGSGTTTATTSVVPTASPSSLDLEAHLLGLLPESSQRAIQGAFFSPQQKAFNLVIEVFQRGGVPPLDESLVDLFAMMTFFISSKVNDWTDSVPSLDTSHEFGMWCQIPFLECDATSQTFVSVELTGGGVDGFIPPELGLVRNLTEIDLSHNAIHQEIPPELGLLQKLHYLDLSANQLEGSIPTTLLQSSSSSFSDGGLPPPPLTTVLLHDNFLHGPLAPEWALLHETLTTLQLHGNRFEGTIPQSWSGLTNLRTLTLHDNPGLSGSVPRELCERSRAGTLTLTLDCSRVACEASCRCHCVR